MKIIRFRDESDRTRVGSQRNGGQVMMLEDPYGTLNPGRTSNVRDLLKNRCAVVADDDDNMCRMIATILRRFGCRCIVCRDGNEAVRALESNTVDLVVSDIQMPHRNGYEIFRTAKELNPGMPIVLVTGFGYDPNHSLIRAEEDGLTSVLYKPFAPEELLQKIDLAIRDSVASAAELLTPTGQLHAGGKLLAPLDPRCIIGVGRNYRPRPGSGATPSDREPQPSPEDLELFLKPPSSVQHPGGLLQIPRFSDAKEPHLHAEAELAIVVGLPMHNVEEGDVRRHILGSCVALDITALYFQNLEGSPRWFRGKGFDTFCPLGPAIVTLDLFPFPPAASIRTQVNGVETRSGTIGDMLRTPDELLSLLSRHCTIESGTVILTGGPPVVPGVDDPPPPLHSGDRVTAEIDGIGVLEVCVE